LKNGDLKFANHFADNDQPLHLKVTLECQIIFVLPVSRRDRQVNNLKSAMIALAKHLIVATSVPNQQPWQNLKAPTPTPPTPTPLKPEFAPLNLIRINSQLPQLCS
jgi:hypothetical protein